MNKEALAENIFIITLVFLKILGFAHMPIGEATILLEWLLVIWLIFFDVPRRLNNSLKTRIFRTDLLLRCSLLATTLGFFIFLTSTGDLPTILPLIVIDKVVTLVCVLTLVLVSVPFFSRRISRYTSTEIPLVYKAFFVEDLSRSTNRYVMGFSLTILSLLLSFGLLLLLFLDVLLLIFLFLLLLANLRHPLDAYKFWTKVDTELLWDLGASYKPLTISNLFGAASLIFNIITVTSFIIVWGENYGVLFIILSGGWYVLFVLFQITRRSLHAPLYLRRRTSKKELPTLPPRCDFCIALSLSWTILNILMPLFMPSYLWLDLPFEWVLITFVLILVFSLFVNAFCVETIAEWKKQKRGKEEYDQNKGRTINRELLYDRFRTHLILSIVWLSIAFAGGGIYGVIAIICMCGALIMLSFYDQVDMKLRKSSQKTYATLTACYFALGLALGLFSVGIMSPEARGVSYIAALAFAIIVIYCWIADLKRGNKATGVRIREQYDRSVASH